MYARNRARRNESPKVTNDTDIDLAVVDDDSEFRSTLVRRFARRGYRVQEAADGVAALDLAERRQFDVAIFDMIDARMSESSCSRRSSIAPCRV